jgi:hypothetical protein
MKVKKCFNSHTYATYSKAVTYMHTDYIGKLRKLRMPRLLLKIEICCLSETIYAQNLYIILGGMCFALQVFCKSANF